MRRKRQPTPGIPGLIESKEEKKFFLKGLKRGYPGGRLQWLIQKARKIDERRKPGAERAIKLLSRALKYNLGAEDLVRTAQAASEHGWLHASAAVEHGARGKDIFFGSRAAREHGVDAAKAALKTGVTGREIIDFASEAKELGVDNVFRAMELGAEGAEVLSFGKMLSTHKECAELAWKMGFRGLKLHKASWNIHSLGEHNAKAALDAGFSKWKDFLYAARAAQQFGAEHMRAAAEVGLKGRHIALGARYSKLYGQRRLQEIIRRDFKLPLHTRLWFKLTRLLGKKL